MPLGGEPSTGTVASPTGSSAAHAGGAWCVGALSGFGSASSSVVTP